MRLTPEQITKLLKTPTNKDRLFFAAKQEERLVLHNEAVQDVAKLNAAFGRWSAWVKSILPKDKHERFFSLITVPLPTNKQLQSIFTELKKVFESQNGSKKVEFVDPSFNQDFQDFNQRTQLYKYSQNQLWEAVRTQVCSFIVIDCPQKQTTTKPEPYPCIIPASNVWDCQYDTDGDRLEYLMFITHADGATLMTVIDDEFYYQYQLDDETGEYVLLFKTQHSTFDALGNCTDGPGYTPATGVWKVATKGSKHIEKIGPVTNVLGDLDWYMFKEISFKYLGLYADYPIIYTYKTVCDYKNDQGMMCEGGRVERVTGETSIFEECPACVSRKQIGPGSVGTIDAPRDETDVDLMDKPIHIAEVSNDKLEYGGNYLDDLENDIFQTSVGQDISEASTMAQNEKQIVRSVESKESVLNRIANSLQFTEKFIIDTVCYIRYGRRAFLGSYVNYGTQHYLLSTADLDASYQAAKTSGKPMYELAEIRDVTNKTQNRSNPDQLLRNEILSQLEPWPDLAIAQIQGLSLNASDTVNFAIKINFNSYIQRFERENMNIVEFGSMMDMAYKIKIIQTKLQDYGKETITSARPDPRADAQPPKPTN